MAKTVQKVNPDLTEERQNVSFDVNEFKRWFYGGQSNVEDLKFFGKFMKVWSLDKKAQSPSSNFTENYFINDPEMRFDLDTSYMSHKEKYEESIRRATITVKKLKKLQAEGRLGKDQFMWVIKSTITRNHCWYVSFYLQECSTLYRDVSYISWRQPTWSSHGHVCTGT